MKRAWKSKDFLVALEAFFLLSFLFVFASGGFFSIFPYTHLKEYSKEKRIFMITCAIGVAAIIAGTAVFVVPYKWDGSLGKLPLHLRYCAMYLPMMLTFTTDLDSFPKKNKGYTAALIAFIILCFFPGARAGFVAGKTGIVDSFALASFVKVNTLNGNLTGWLVTAFVVLASLVFLFIPMEQKGISDKEKQKMFNLAKVFFILFLTANSVCAHIGANVYIDPSIAKDAMEVKETVGAKEALGICQRYYDDIYSYWLDGRLVYPMQQVTSDQIFVQMEETGGVYSPFVPVEQAPNVHNHKTPDTDTLVLGMTIAEHMEWNRSASARTTENGHFTILTIDPSKRWVDTMMYGLDDDTLYPDVGGYIHIYDQNRNIGGNIYLTITASGNGKLKIGSKTISLESQEKSYEVTIPFSEYISLTAEDKAVNIKSYSTKTK